MLAAIQRLEMGASATGGALAFEVNQNVLHRWWREFHLGPWNAWASGLDRPGGRRTRCLLETDTGGEFLQGSKAMSPRMRGSAAHQDEAPGGADAV
jgi:transposase